MDTLFAIDKLALEALSAHLLMYTMPLGRDSLRWLLAALTTMADYDQWYYNPDGRLWFRLAESANDALYALDTHAAPMPDDLDLWDSMPEEWPAAGPADYSSPDLDLKF